MILQPFVQIALGQYKLSVAGDGRANTIWAKSYSNTLIRDEDHLRETIYYIENNHIKHDVPPCNRRLQPSAITAPDKAFEPQYTGGFDVVIGNPPYGAELSKEDQEYYNRKFQIGSTDTAILFIKQAKSLLNESGLIGFIIPKAFSFASNYQKIREFIWHSLKVLIDCKKVWKEVLLEQVIIIVSAFNEKYFSGILKDHQIEILGEISKLTSQKFGFFLNGISEIELNIGNKIHDGSKYLNDFAINKRGIIINIFNNNGKYSVIGGNEIDKYGIRSVRGLVNDIYKNTNAKINPNSLLVQGIVSHIENPTDHIKIIACVPDINIDYLADNLNQLTLNEGFSNRMLWCILNSKLMNWYAYRFIYGKAIRTMRFDNPITSRIPIPLIVHDEQLPFIAKADAMISMNKELQQIKNCFASFIKDQFFGCSNRGLKPSVAKDIDSSRDVKPSVAVDNDTGKGLTADFKLPTKLQNWHELEFNEFVKELVKAKVKLTATEKFDIMPLFDREKAKATELKTAIDRTDKEIDRMVYELYGLTEEEIRIVEGE